MIGDQNNVVERNRNKTLYLPSAIKVPGSATPYSMGSLTFFFAYDD